MVKEILEDLKDGNKLKEYVLNYYIDDIENYDNIEDLITSLKDLQKYGCVSGMIHSLIYYDDTNKFYDEYKEEINELLSHLMINTGLSIAELFGNKFDNEDPLILDISNKNLLAWFGFEETAYSIYENIIEKINYKDIEFAY